MSSFFLLESVQLCSIATRYEYINDKKIKLIFIYKYFLNKLK